MARTQLPNSEQTQNAEETILAYIINTYEHNIYNEISI